MTQPLLYWKLAQPTKADTVTGTSNTAPLALSMGLSAELPRALEPLRAASNTALGRAESRGRMESAVEQLRNVLAEIL